MASRGRIDTVYGLDELRADGVVIIANSKGTYLGDGDHHAINRVNAERLFPRLTPPADATSGFSAKQ